mmetsp:Transcript_11221/g.25271  ORF Transcript_11221/g.25271 Transcript_11221/m.25271 type:complete len:210 (-) Transcript_11221:187-816(-)
MVAWRLVRRLSRCNFTLMENKIESLLHSLLIRATTLPNGSLANNSPEFFVRSCETERRFAVRILLLHVAAVFDEQQAAILLLCISCVVQRSLLALVFQESTWLLLKQKAQHSDTPSARRGMERRCAVLVRFLEHRRVLSFHQHLNNAQVTFGSCVVQRTLSGPTCCANVRACIYQRTHDVDVSCGRRGNQRCERLVVTDGWQGTYGKEV